MGRDRKNERRGEHFAKMVRALMEEPAWRALSPEAQALYPWLRLEWRGPNSNNNGQLRLSVRQAAQRLGIGTNRAARAFHDLQKKGFAVVKEGAQLGVSGEAASPAYELTELAPAHAQSHEGRKLYRDWRPGYDYPVYKAAANNPRGRNGKNETLSSNWGQGVINLRTR